ncbi:hypothetical protein B0H19DRAFT_534996 [Mycena capillaripes]|nr:hypothetical protein B0H19DRAFT_534996 [Mycena capillaripes]
MRALTSLIPGSDALQRIRSPQRSWHAPARDHRRAQRPLHTSSLLYAAFLASTTCSSAPLFSPSTPVPLAQPHYHPPYHSRAQHSRWLFAMRTAVAHRRRHPAPCWIPASLVHPVYYEQFAVHPAAGGPLSSLLNAPRASQRKNLPPRSTHPQHNTQQRSSWRSPTPPCHASRRAPPIWRASLRQLSPIAPAIESSRLPRPPRTPSSSLCTMDHRFSRTRTHRERIYS